MNTPQMNASGLKHAAPIESVDPDELLTAAQAAELLHQRLQTLAGWRCENRGPEYLKVGRTVFYRRAALSTWLAGHIVRPSAGGAL